MSKPLPNEIEKRKEPWKMTKEEYQKSQIGKKYKDFLGRENEVSGTDAEQRVQGYVHREYIIQAIERGEKIPNRVLNQYPDIVRKNKSIIERIELFLEQGTVTADIDMTPAGGPMKKKKKYITRRRLLSTKNGL